MSVRLKRDAPLSEYTRFGLGGPAKLLVDADDEASFIAEYRRIEASGDPMEVIGGGSNLVVSDDGFDGAILRCTEASIRRDGGLVTAGAGVVWQDLVDFTIEQGLAGFHSMTRIPGWVGGAVYGNAGAYGSQIDHHARSVRFFDGHEVREFSNAECGFRYRHSTFKDNKAWIVLSATFDLKEAPVEELRAKADEIRAIRDSKFPPTMKCAGSIFKNLIFAELPPSVQAQVEPSKIIHSKVPSAYFLEAVGAKGMKNGGIHVADYHANLIYNVGNGTALEVRQIIADLKARVRVRFGFEVEEEVQYVGF